MKREKLAKTTKCHRLKQKQQQCTVIRKMAAAMLLFIIFLLFFANMSDCNVLNRFFCPILTNLKENKSKYGLFRSGGAQKYITFFLLYINNYLY